MNNQTRSPRLGAAKLLIGLVILTTLIIISFFIRYSSDIIFAADSDNEEIIVIDDIIESESLSTEVTNTEEVLITDSIETIDNYISGNEINNLNDHYLPTEVYEAKEEARYNEWLENEEYLPTSTREEKHRVEYEEENKKESGTYYGTMSLTAYTWSGNRCADGVYPSASYTVACNNKDLWHKWIYIEGLGTYYVHDTGGMGYGVVDIYFNTYNECITFGRRSANVYVLD